VAHSASTRAPSSPTRPSSDLADVDPCSERRVGAGRTADLVARFDDQRFHTGLGEIGGADQPVVTTADDDRSRSFPAGRRHPAIIDRKSTRLNSSHVQTSYAVV